jgi:ribonuclease P protein component
LPCITPSFKLPREARICKRKEILFLQNKGTKIHTKNLVMIFRRRTTGSSRIAITTSKKVDKKAVVRNIAKRRIKEIFRLMRSSMAGSIDILFIARQSIKTCNYRTLENEITSALKQRKLLN